MSSSSIVISLGFRPLFKSALIVAIYASMPFGEKAIDKAIGFVVKWWMKTTIVRS